jgi:ribulose-5-phosphate 4-epimerase/fuculose-1-phosphate aldolase
LAFDGELPMHSTDLDAATREALTEAARACRVLDMEGHGDMTLGHLSVREKNGRGFWMKRNQIGLGEVLGSEDFVLVDWAGQKIAGGGGRHSEWPIHSEIFRVRPDVDIVVHSHPFHASVFSAATEPLLPYTLDTDYFGEVPRYEGGTALVVTKEEGQDIAGVLSENFAVLLANHGVVFCGTGVAHAVCVGIFLEKACKAHLAGRAADLEASFPDRAARDRRHKQIATPVHFEHSWRYFCRKLETRTKIQGTETVFI